VDSHLQSATRLHLDLACVKLTNTEAKLNETEQKLEATRKVVEKLDTRIFIWRITILVIFGDKQTLVQRPTKNLVKKVFRSILIEQKVMDTS